MIPKKIHYCWFGRNSLSPLALQCIESWKRFLPDYEIFEWNETNYDVHKNQYISQAYEAKKYAFVSDYARFDILYNYGGVYFDTDVEVIKNMDEILKKGPYLGLETYFSVNPGLGMAGNIGEPFFKKILDSYSNQNFILDNGQLNTKYNVVHRTSELLRKDGLESTNRYQCVDGINIYPIDFFCPKDVRSLELKITDNTFSIHHFDASWVDKYTKKMMLEKQWINNHVGNYVIKCVLTKIVVLKKIVMSKLDKSLK